MSHVYSKKEVPAALGAPAHNDTTNVNVAQESVTPVDLSLRGKFETDKPQPSGSIRTSARLRVSCMAIPSSL